MGKRFLLGFLFLTSFIAVGQVEGCTDILAENYNSSATINDGSCTYTETTISAFEVSSIPEILKDNSGLVYHRDSLISFNDFEDPNLYIFPPENPENYRTVALEGAATMDWEEMAEDDQYFYVGDIGNNINGARQDLKIYRFLKEELDSSPNLESIEFSYDQQTDWTPTSGVNQTDFDAEAFIVTQNYIYIFTKEWNSHHTSVYQLEKTPGEHQAVYEGSWDVDGLITGAEFFEEEKLVVLVGYSTLLRPFVYLLYDYEGDDFFSGNKRKIKIDLPWHQVEGIASMDGLNYMIVNELLYEEVFGQVIHIPAALFHLDLTEFLDHYLGNELGINQPATQDLVLYPNPTSDYIYINGLDLTQFENGQMELFDINGRIVYTEKITNQKREWSLKEIGLTKGIYFFLLREKDQVIKKKLILY